MLFRQNNRSLFSSGKSSAPNSQQQAPEINLIAFIDVLLVILIFLMISTTFTRYQELSITLPAAEGAASKSKPKDISIAITSDGRIAIDGKWRAEKGTFEISCGEEKLVFELENDINFD
jgi:biopolymer transport protein ExbD